jgi:hypothetical protein
MGLRKDPLLGMPCTAGYDAQCAQQLKGPELSSAAHLHSAVFLVMPGILPATSHPYAALSCSFTSFTFTVC